MSLPQYSSKEPSGLKTVIDWLLGGVMQTSNALMEESLESWAFLGSLYLHEEVEPTCNSVPP